jgi:putative ABC transport system permease protein
VIPLENDDVVPIFVDYNTLVWIYEGSMGRIYTIEDESGTEVKLEVIGILENSVFGGTFIMSEGNLERLYPSRAEYKYLLFKINPGVETSNADLATQLEQQLNEYGLDAEVISEMIRENNAYERSFMGLFQAFLGLGLVVGILGLGAITARNVQERKYELGVLRALGYTRRMIIKAFLLEPVVIGT